MTAESNTSAIDERTPLLFSRTQNKDQKSKQRTSSNFDQIPDDILRLIFQYLKNKRDLVCSRFHRISSEDWLWKEIYEAQHDKASQFRVDKDFRRALVEEKKEKVLRKMGAQDKKMQREKLRKKLENRLKLLKKMGITHRASFNVLPLLLLFLFNVMLTLKLDHLFEFTWASVFSPLFILWLWSVLNLILHYWADYLDRKWHNLMGSNKLRVFYKSSLVAELAGRITKTPFPLRIFPLISYLGLSAAIFSGFFHAQFHWKAVSATFIGTSLSASLIGFQIWMTCMVKSHEWKEFIGLSSIVFGYTPFFILSALQLDGFINWPLWAIFIWPASSYIILLIELPLVACINLGTGHKRYPATLFLLFFPFTIISGFLVWLYMILELDYHIYYTILFIPVFLVELVSPVFFWVFRLKRQYC